MYCTYFFFEPLHCCLKIRLANLKQILAASSWFHHLKPNVDQHFHSPSARCRGSLCLGPQKISRFGLRRLALPSRELTYPTWAKGKSSSKVLEKKNGICDDQIVPWRVWLQNWNFPKDLALQNVHPKLAQLLRQAGDLVNTEAWIWKVEKSKGRTVNR